MTNVDYAVTGFGAFAVSTFLLQLHNIGFCSIAPVICVGFVYGGILQIIAGFLCNDTFASSAFIGYGSFWINFSLLLMFKYTNLFKINVNDVACFLFVYTIFTMIMWLHVVRSRVLTNTILFSTLFISFILLYITETSGIEWLKTISTWLLLFTSLCAFYKMASHLFPIRVLP